MQSKDVNFNQITPSNFDYEVYETFDEIQSCEFESTPDTRPNWAQSACGGLSWETISRVIKLSKKSEIKIPEDAKVEIIHRGTTSSGNRPNFNDLYVTEVFVNGQSIGTYTY